MLDPSATNLTQGLFSFHNPAVMTVTPLTASALFFEPQCLANFDTLRAMTGELTQPTHASGNVAG